MSDVTAHKEAPGPRGVVGLPADLTPEQISSAPTMASVDALLIDELTDEEDDAFAAALQE